MMFAVAFSKNGNFWNHLYVSVWYYIFDLQNLILLKKQTHILYTNSSVLSGFYSDNFSVEFSPCVSWFIQCGWFWDFTLMCICGPICIVFYFLYLAFYFFKCVNMILMRMQLFWFRSISSFYLDIFLMKEIQKLIAERG